MIMNDPFETKSDSIKTILNIDPTTNLLGYMLYINPDMTLRDLWIYFNELYKKFPDDFRLVIEDKNSEALKRYVVHLQFMEHYITGDDLMKPDKINTIGEFFQRWEETLADVGEHDTRVMEDYDC